jgi:uncharacterized protein
MEHFTPLPALAGGLLIGAAAVALLALDGRIAGIAGILNGALAARAGDVAWRLAFLAGLVGGGGLYWHFTPHAFAPRTGYPLVLLLAGGFLVGFGTRLGSGCTSGHGVCGIGRRSVRSIAATLTFLLTGVATTYLLRHVLGGGA